MEKSTQKKSKPVEFRSITPNLLVFVRSPDMEKMLNDRVRYVNGLQAQFASSRFATEDPEMIKGLREGMGFGKLYVELSPHEISASAA